MCALAARVVLSFAPAKGGHHAVDSGAVLGAVNPDGGPVAVTVTAIVLAIGGHALFPRFEWRLVNGKPAILVRIDRWKGTAQWGRWDPATGLWQPLIDPSAKLWSDIDKALSDK